MSSIDSDPAVAGAGDADISTLHTAPAVEFEADKPLSEEDVSLLSELRAAVASVKVPADDVEYWTSDHALHRFLVARNRKVKAAAEMYTKTMAFRTERRCASLLATYRQPEVMKHYFPWGIVGLDKEGFPVLVERVGQIDYINLHAAIGTEEFLTWVCWYHEVQEQIMRRISAKLGRNRHKMTCIIDLSGLSLRHMSSANISVLKQRTRLEEDNYPEVVKRVLIINTPTMFATVWGAVKLFMDQGTVDKLQLIGSNYMPTLLKYVDASVIPKFLGGELVDDAGDPECRNIVTPGGTIAPSYIAGVAADGKGLGEEVTISAGKHTDVILKVPAGATVQWTFGTHDKEVTFRATVLPPGDHAGAIDVAKSVYGVHQLAAPSDKAAVSTATGTDIASAEKVAKGSGQHTFSEGATVRLRWDNSFSWMASKTVVRRIDVLMPGSEADALVQPDGGLQVRAAKREQFFMNFGV